MTDTEKLYRDGYVIIPNMISADAADLIAESLLIHYDNARNRGVVTMNDHLVEENAFSWYGANSTEALLPFLKPKMEEITGKELYPTYSYSRIYYKTSKMPEHTDRDESEFAVSINLSIDETPWALKLKDLHGNIVEAKLNPGDGIVYQGWKCPHWRDPYEEDQQVQAFIFYVDANGQFAHKIYDGRERLGASSVR